MDILIWVLIFIAVTGVLWLFWRVLGSFFFNLYSRPQRIPITQTPADYGLAYRDIDFKTEDNLRLRGWVVLPPDYAEGERRPAVITTHGYSANRSDIIERTVAVARAGFVAFSFDWRASGESEGGICTGGLSEQSDLRAALDIVAGLPEIDPDRIAIYGFSIGAVISIIVAAADPRIRAVVADSPFVSLREMTKHIFRRQLIPPFVYLTAANRVFRDRYGAGMDAIDTAAVAAKIAPRPLLIIYGKRDWVIPPQHSQKVFEAAGEPKKLFVNPTGGHLDNSSPDILYKVVIPFLKEFLA